MSDELKRDAALEMYNALKSAKTHFDNGDIIWEPRQIIAGRGIAELMVLLSQINYALHLAENGRVDEHRPSKPKTNSPDDAG